MILKYPHPKLRKKAKKVEKITPEVKLIAKKMCQEMEKNNGAGLAANQIGKLIRMICYFDNGKSKILINPKVLKRSKNKIEIEEGCLSFPNLFGQVVRPAKVKVEGQNQFAKKVTIKAENLLAVVLQHEIDHLDGVLFIDKVIRKTLHKIEPKQVEAVELNPKGVAFGKDKK